MKPIINDLVIPQDDKNNASSYPIMSSVFLGEAPALLPVKYDIEKRDSLFNELQRMKQIQSPTIEEKSKIISLEQEITKMITAREEK